MGRLGLAAADTPFTPLKKWARVFRGSAIRGVRVILGAPVAFLTRTELNPPLKSPIMKLYIV